jgi:hypothetical protein
MFRAEILLLLGISWVLSSSKRFELTEVAFDRIQHAEVANTRKYLSF